MDPFITGEDIEVRDNLFGRDKEIETLLSLAKRHEMAGIIAPRRFGKTCILKTMNTILRESRGDAYPVYYSAHDYGVSNNTDETYCRMASAVATQMCKDGLLPKGRITLFRKTKVRISTDEIDNYESFCELSSERQRESVFKLADLLRTEDSPKRYLLLLLDEVDYLLLTAFESPDDFMRLRTAATKKLAALKFWVAGPASWKSITNSVGSPGLNCGIQNLSLLPLSFPDFEDMWKYECELIEEESVKNKTLSKLDFAFHKSGGVPFYAKFIGRQYQIAPSKTNEPTFLILRDHLKEMFENRFFTKEEKEIMVNLSRRPINYGESEPEGVSLLIDKGIARKSGEYTELTMEYLVDYLRACEVEVPIGVPGIATNNDLVKINELVDEINVLMDNINDTFQMKRNKFVFENPGSTLKDDERIRTIAHTKEEFGDFLSVVYSMYYERSKAIRPSNGTKQPGQLLYEAEFAATSDPNNFKFSTDYFRNREFFMILEPLRAAYDAHIFEKLDRQPGRGQYTVGEALEHLKGNRNAPETDEWPHLQVLMLTLFKDELTTIKNEVKSIV